jgi:hypothetical protein
MALPELGSTVVDHVRDAFYVAVGLGVIGVTNLGGLRDRLDRPTVDSAALTSAVDALNERLDTVVSGLDDRVATIEARVDAVLDQLEDGLPVPAREVLGNARGAAKEARAQLRSLGRRAA